MTIMNHEAQNRILVPEGLFALHGYVSPDLTADVAVELNHLAREWPIAVVGDNEDIPVTRTRTVSDVYQDFSPQLKGLLGILGVSMRDSMAFNHQPPMARQRFHTDGSDVVVFHYAGEGSFDYAPDATCLYDSERDYVTEDMHKGDVLVSFMPKLWHRGRNRSSLPRTNVVFFKSLKEKWELQKLLEQKKRT